MHTIKNYVMAESLEQAWELNKKGRNNVIIGGNMWLRMGSRNFVNAIDLSKLGLDRIEEEAAGFRIGCMVSLRQLETHEGLNLAFDGLFQEAVRHIVGVQFRNGATVGGSIFPKLGFSDVLTAFLACDTTILFYKKGEVSLRNFISLPADDDIITHLYVKKDGRRTAYDSFRMTQTDFPTLTCAVAKTDTACEVVVGARPKHADVITDMPLFDLADGHAVKAYAREAADRFTYGSNMRGSAAYRRELAKVLIARCLTRLSEEKNAD